MQKRLLGTLVPLTVAIPLALGSATLLGAQEAGEKRTITGEVIDIVSYVQKGARGEEFAEAGRFRAEKGFPVGILESETEEVYVCIYRDPAPASALEPANDKLAPLMGKEVVGQGTVFERQGMKVIELILVAEM